MDRRVRQQAAVTSSVSLVRPELVEIKNSIKNLKREAEMRLTLDVEAQQSFDFLSDQVQGLRKAFSTLSDVLIEEVDLIRSEAIDRHAELQQRNDELAKSLKVTKTETSLLRAEAQAFRSDAHSKLAVLGERIELLQEDSTVLAQEVAKGSSAQHLLQLEVVQLRSHLEEEGRARTADQQAQTDQLRQFIERFDTHQHEARASMQALDSDLASIRAHTEQHFATHNSAIDANKAKILQCSQVIEKLWGSAKLTQQRLESVSSGGSLQYQQLQERLESINKQQTRWRATVEETVKGITADMQLIQTHSRAMEAAIGSNKAEARRLVSEHEGEVRQQCDTLGRAIHSLAETLNLTSPLVGLQSRQ